MTATDIPRFRYLGVTDECVQCEKCGKADLRTTIMIVPLDVEGNDDGDPVYYGSTCAARALGVKGGGRAALQSARWAHERAKNAADDARRMLAHYGLPEEGEPARDVVLDAMRRYVAAHPNVHRFVAETGIGVRARVLDMLTRKRAALADARALKIPGY